MIGMRTILEVADNSGARRLQAILPRGGDKGLRAGLGDIVTASVKEAAPDSNIKKGKVVKCVIVRMRKETRRKDGTYIRFDTNAAVLVNDLGEPVGTRVFGPVARELRDKRFMKIVSLAPEVIKMAEPVRIRIKKNDTVKVIAGKDKGKTGRVLEVNRETGRILVEGVQMIKR